jgi:hypothetical protein
MFRIADCIRGCVRFAIPQPTEWQRIGNEINAAMISARSHFIRMLRGAGDFTQRKLENSLIADV